MKRRDAEMRPTSNRISAREDARPTGVLLAGSARGLLNTVMSYLFNKPERLGSGESLGAAALKILHIFKDFAVSGAS